MKKTRVRNQLKGGTIINGYKIFLVVIGLAELLVNYSTMQTVDGHVLSNGALLPITIAISLCMMFAGHYTGTALRTKAIKAAVIAIALASLLLFIIIYLRAVSSAPIILALTNIVFYGTVAIVSFLRAKNQHFFDCENEFQAGSAEKAELSAENENLKSNYAKEQDLRNKNSEIAAEQAYATYIAFLEDSIIDAESIIETIDLRKTQLIQAIKSVEQEGLNACIKYNSNSL